MFLRCFYNIVRASERSRRKKSKFLQKFLGQIRGKSADFTEFLQDFFRVNFAEN